jgi:hypothetical protein
VHPWPSGATATTAGWLELGSAKWGGLMGVAGPRGLYEVESPSSLQRITHRQLMLRTSTARHRTRFVHVEEPVGMRWSQCCCPGPGLVLDEQRHSMAAGVQGPRSKRAFSPSAPLRTLTHSLCKSQGQGQRARTKGGARFNRASALTTCMLKRPLRTLIRIQCRGKNWSAHARAGQSNEDSLCSVVRTYGWQAQPSRIQAGALAGTWDGQLTTTWRGDDCLRSASSSCSTH